MPGNIEFLVGARIPRPLCVSRVFLDISYLKIAVILV
jgi:hypothetical protein